MHYKSINDQLGNVDIYLLDQILKGHFEGRKRILDAGCGEGRNLKYFIDNDYEVYGNDIEPMALKMAQMTYRQVPADRFVQCSIENLQFESGYFDAIICAAVIHFANNQDHFEKMIQELHRCLKKEGFLFIRMATDVGIKHDQTFPFVLDEKNIERTFLNNGFRFLEPWKSVVVEGKRSMGVFSVLKN